MCCGGKAGRVHCCLFCKTQSTRTTVDKISQLVQSFFGIWFSKQYVAELICASKGHLIPQQMGNTITQGRVGFTPWVTEIKESEMEGDLLKREELLAGFSSIGLALLLLNIFICGLDTNCRRCYRNLLIALSWRWMKREELRTCAAEGTWIPTAQSVRGGSSARKRTKCHYCMKSIQGFTRIGTNRPAAFKGRRTKMSQGRPRHQDDEMESQELR